jgi:hypothetical protein
MLASFPGSGVSGSKAVTGMDICVRKPIVVTVGVDRCLRVWNYNFNAANKPAGEFLPTLELTKQFDEEPTWCDARIPAPWWCRGGVSRLVVFCFLLFLFRAVCRCIRRDFTSQLHSIRACV